MVGKEFNDLPEIHDPPFSGNLSDIEGIETAYLLDPYPPVRGRVKEVIVLVFDPNHDVDPLPGTAAWNMVYFISGGFEIGGGIEVKISVLRIVPDIADICKVRVAGNLPFNIRQFISHRALTECHT